MGRGTSVARSQLPPHDGTRDKAASWSSKYRRCLRCARPNSVLTKQYWTPTSLSVFKKSTWNECVCVPQSERKMGGRHSFCDRATGRIFSRLSMASIAHRGLEPIYSAPSSLLCEPNDISPALPIIISLCK